MTPQKRRRLESLGYRVTNAQEFLGLSDGEIAVIDLKIALIEKLKKVRRARGVTQHELAKRMRSSQSRVAMLERASPDVSLDLVCRALFALGLTQSQLAQAIRPKKAA